MLLWLTFLPLVGVLAILLAPDRAGTQRGIALLTSLVVAVLGLVLWGCFEGGDAAMQLTTSIDWFEIALPAGHVVPVHFAFGVDGISILLVVLTAVLMPFVVLSTAGHIDKRFKEFFLWLLVMETGMLGVFLSTDLVQFYFFWELSLVPLYFILGIWGGSRRLYATIKFFLYTVAGSLVMLIAIISLLYQTGTSDISELISRAGGLDPSQQAWIFGSFALAFAIKVPMLPFHTWLADAHTEAPTSGSVILAGVLLKMGTYGLLRFGIQLFPEMALSYSGLFLCLGAAGIVYGAFLAMAQSDLKRLVACSSVSHLGFVVLGMFALTEAGLRGSVLQMVNHGISTGLLFLLVGMIYERRHTRMLDRFGGVARVMPVFAFFFVFTVLSSAGLPGLNGFVGEYMILSGTFLASPLWAAVAVTGVIFGAVYLLVATRRVLFGPLVHEENKALTDLGMREIGILVPLCVLALWIGISPNTFVGKTAGTLDQLSERIHQIRADDARTAEVSLLEETR
ncbi:MAG TPA: NADH-quinone oxidoreductase subunit M [Planctomycetes bacterium]|nr:NADH-quinone oxidoreductase subunit M [Planctomycetota bacterium]